MSGIWYVIVPEASRNFVLNPSAELDGNFGLFVGGSPSQSNSPSGSASPSASESRSPSASSSPSGSQSRSPSASASPSASVSPTPSGSVSPSTSVSPSPSPSAQLGAVTRVTTYARFGDYCYYAQPSAAYDGMTLLLSTLANAIHYVSLYVYDNLGSGSIEVSLNGNAFHALTVIGGRDTGWVRYGAQIPAAQASGSIRLYIRNTADENFYVDAVQVEANSYGTTYIDGDRGGSTGSPFYRWSGLRHGSSSTRSAQERTGGRERNLLDDYGVEVVEGTKRIGMPPIIHNLQSQSLLPGALYQGVKVLPREIELHLNYSSDSWAGFHGKRNDVIDLLKPDLVRGSQPVVIGYAGPGTDKRVYAQFHYNGGMEFGDFLAYDEVAPVRLLAPDPFWEADDQETAVLDYQDSVTAAYAARRTNGQWQALGGGFNNFVLASAVDTQRGRIYLGGTFTNSGRVGYWDGSTFIGLGSGVNNSVYALAIAANGDVWAAGVFTTAGGATCKGLARWNVATGTWTAFNPSTTIFTQINDIAISPVDGKVYITGIFTDWDGIANADNIAVYDGAAWAALGTGLNSDGEALIIDGSGNVYVGGDFTSAGGVANTTRLAKWDGSVFTALSTGANARVFDLILNPNGLLFVTGNFTTIGGISAGYIAGWNGTSFFILGSGLNSGGQRLGLDDRGILYVAGGFSSAGGLTLADRIAAWNGSTWTHLDIDFPGSPTIRTFTPYGDDLYVGFDTTGTATVAGLTTATNGGSTAAYPRLSVINGNASGSCTLQWFENQSSDHLMYFNLAIQAGEKVELDLSNSQKRLVSDWRGRITDNPLKNSDVVNWKLLPGANTIAAFITGTVTSVTALLHWTPRYWSADGAA